jgi:hypothetical protein
VTTERLTALPDGRLLYRLKRAWRDGTAAVIFERQDFISKLAVLVPAPGLTSPGIMGSLVQPYLRRIEPRRTPASFRAAANAETQS